MSTSNHTEKYIGILLLAGMITGIFSVAPAVDSENYLRDAAANIYHVFISAVFQFVMGLTYIFVAILFYPIIKSYNSRVAVGFLSFRIIATTLVIIGTILLVVITLLSQKFVQTSSADIQTFKTVGYLLKTTRDQINHVFMVFSLCTGNILLYYFLLRSKIAPKWISLWGLISATLSIISSMLLLFRVLDIITPEYLFLNTPTALHELVFGIWLLTKGLDKNNSNS